VADLSFGKGLSQNAVASATKAATVLRNLIGESATFAVPAGTSDVHQ
jgi:hypothetical protein